MRVVLYWNQNQKSSSSSSPTSSLSGQHQQLSSSGGTNTSSEGVAATTIRGAAPESNSQLQSTVETTVLYSNQNENSSASFSNLLAAKTTSSSAWSDLAQDNSSQSVAPAVTHKSTGESKQQGLSVASNQSEVNPKKKLASKRKATINNTPAGRKTTGIQSILDTKPKHINKKVKTTKNDSQVAAVSSGLSSTKTREGGGIRCTKFGQQQQQRKESAVTAAKKKTVKMGRIPDNYNERYNDHDGYEDDGYGESYGSGRPIELRSQESSSVFDDDEVIENDPASARGEYNNHMEENYRMAARRDYNNIENDPDSTRGKSCNNNFDNINNNNNNENDPAFAEGEGDTYSQFEKALKQRGLEIREQDGDGNCLFRAVSLQVYGDANMHMEVRKRCLDFMARDEEHFSHFVTGEPFKDYIKRKKEDGVHGNNPEIQAISELFNRPVEVFVEENGAQPLNIFHAEYKTADTPIRLSYHDGNHYNAVIDPLLPTAGLGLGLPGLEPGLADRMQVAKAKEESDRLADEAEMEKAREASYNDQLQRALKDSSLSVDQMYKQKAMALSDLEATEIEMEQALVASSLESYQQSESARKPSSARRRQNGRSSPSRTSSSSTKNNNPSSVARLQSPGTNNASSISAAIPPHASASAATASSAFAGGPLRARDEYPQTVQELVMNGFELSKVVKAYELIGDSFDDILAFLMSSTR